MRKRTIQSAQGAAMVYNFCIQEDRHDSHNKKVAFSIYGLPQLLPSKHGSRLSYALPRQQYPRSSFLLRMLFAFTCSMGFSRVYCALNTCYVSSQPPTCTYIMYMDTEQSMNHILKKRPRYYASHTLLRNVHGYQYIL